MLILRPGNIVYSNAKGSTSMDDRASTPISVDTVFWIASCTKLMTTIAALQCVEKGLLQLDDQDQTAKVLPEYGAPNILSGFTADGTPQLVPSQNMITLRTLLTHTSGLGYDFLSPDLKRWKDWDNQAKGSSVSSIRLMLPKTVTYGCQTAHSPVPLLFAPGTQFEYGISIDILGRMVESVTGVSLEAYMTQNIWQPLGMKSTTLDIESSPSLRERWCSLTSRSEDGKLIAVPPHPYSIARTDKGGGGAFSTPNDYIKLLVSLLKNDGTLLRPETVDAMFTPQLDDPGILTHYMTTAAGPMCRSGVDSNAWNFGLGGILNTEDVEGICKAGTLSWGGLPNLYWVSRSVVRSCWY